MGERRDEARHRVLKAGTIEVGGGAIDCSIRDLSDTGAALDVTSPVGIPERFILFVQADEIDRSCTVVWRKEKRIGVKFG